MTGSRPARRRSRDAGRLDRQIEGWWRDQGDVSITPEVIEQLVGGVDAELEPCDLSRLPEQRNEVLMSLLKDEHNQSPRRGNRGEPR